MSRPSPRTDLAVVVPAFRAERLVGGVVETIARYLPDLAARIYVIDDGSGDGTADAARAAGAKVIAHERNRGKGAALVTGMRAARADGYALALTVDADGQHPGPSCQAVADAPDPTALVLGIRDLARDGAPRMNQFSNGVSNFFLSAFAGRRFGDTQCGLRRYPIDQALALGARADGYAFEAEIVLLWAAAGLPFVEVPAQVTYPPGKERVTHFDSVRDPARIIRTVLGTVARTRLFGARRRGAVSGERA